MDVPPIEADDAAGAEYHSSDEPASEGIVGEKPGSGIPSDRSQWVPITVFGTGFAC